MLTPNEAAAVAEQVEDVGYCLLRGIFSADQLQGMIEQLEAVFRQESEAIRHRSGAVYAMRNVLSLWPAALEVARQPVLQQVLQQILGPQVGLVRGLYFDKPPEQTWSLPWHKDLLIAVQEGAVTSPDYSPLRLRLGVPHTEPPTEVLEQMLTARIHLDAMTPDNGPLEVLPGSQRTGKRLKIDSFEPVKILCSAGDVLLMRPLLAHASGKSTLDCSLHRRILHLEFSALPQLPEGPEWWEFHSLKGTSFGVRYSGIEKP